MDMQAKSLADHPSQKNPRRTCTGAFIVSMDRTNQQVLQMTFGLQLEVVLALIPALMLHASTGKRTLQAYRAVGS